MNFLELLKRFFSWIIASIKKGMSNLLQKIQTKRRFLIIGMCLFGILLGFCFFVIVRGVRGGNNAPPIPLPSGVASGSQFILPEELFLPEEPDFIPEFIPEREKRTAWTSSDAEAYWIDPLSEGSDKYFEMIDTTINNLMERVR